MSYKRVYILGAGSSIGHSQNKFPDIRHFFQYAHSAEINLARDYNELHDYVRRIFNKDIIEDLIDIEAVFTHLELDIEKSISPELKILRRSLLGLIKKLLTDLENSLSNEESEFHLFYNILNKNEKDTIITFNWDLLLDNIIGREDVLSNDSEKRTRWTHYNNFAWSLTAYREQNAWEGGVYFPYSEWVNKWPDSTVYNKGLFLKLHGSIDWFQCLNERCKAFGWLYPLLDYQDIHYCSWCDEDVGNVLIPPIMNKSIRGLLPIRRIWNTAIKELYTANEIIIWGYSLPQTDFYSLWLLRQFNRKLLKRVLVIDPIAFEGNGKEKLFKARISEPFSGCLGGSDIQYYRSFRNYLESL